MIKDAELRVASMCDKNSKIFYKPAFTIIDAETITSTKSSLAY